jgi:hypothetical protein
MLHKSSDKVRHCYERALVARERGSHTANPVLQEWHATMEEHWLRLAWSYEISESIMTFNGDLPRQIGLVCKLA